MSLFQKSFSNHRYMRSPKLLVTGGCGFIGSNFVRLMLEDDGCMLKQMGLSGLVNLDALTYAGNSSNHTDILPHSFYAFAKGDIADRDLVANLLREHGIRYVIHFAAESHVDRSIDSPEPFFQTNTVGTLRLLDCVRHYWSELPVIDREHFRFLHVSTDEVYGSLQPDEPAFRESTPYSPNSPYAASKAASDFIVRSCHHTYGLPVLTTNCSNNYGPYQFPEKLIPLMILNALDGKPLPIYGDGLNVRDWLYVRDHCEAITAVLQNGRIGETYNIGGLNEQPNLRIVDTICELLDKCSPRVDGKSYKEQKRFVKDRPGHDRRYAIDCSKLMRELGWKPRESWASGMRKTVQWYLDNSNWCAEITTRTYQRQRLGI